MGDDARRPTGTHTSAKTFVGRIGLAVILVVIILVIILSPFELAFLARFRNDWVVLGNVGQAYGGASAILSALALIGVAGSLLLQTRQHSIDRMAAARTQQSHIYDVIRADPALYWPIIGGANDNARSARKRIFSVEYLAYLLAGYETGYIPEGALRGESFSGFFRYEENRRTWDDIRPSWIAWVMDSQSKKQRNFVTIADQELARARAIGPGLAFPQSVNPGKQALDRLSKRHLSTAAGMAAAASLTFFLARRMRSQRH